MLQGRKTDLISKGSDSTILSKAFEVAESF